jgi:aspartate-semialdehyde dehydrogenase
MKSSPSLAILGATGLVGNEIVVALDQRKVPLREVRLIASEDSIGEVYKIGQHEVAVQALTEEALDGIDIACVVLPPQMSGEWIEKIKHKVPLVIDVTGAFRDREGRTLYIAELSPEKAQTLTGVISIPSSPTLPVALALRHVIALGEIERVVVSTYQPCSGAGKHAVDELWEQTRAIFNQKELPQEVFNYQVAFNAIPQVGVMRADSATSEEHAIESELNELFSGACGEVLASCVRIPVLYGDGISLSVTMKQPLDVAALRARFEADTNFAYYGSDDIAMLNEAAGRDEVLIGRLRVRPHAPRTVTMWLASDNVRRGAALTTVRLIEERFSVIS